MTWILDRTERERVGAKFTFRASQIDIGMVGEVASLYEGHPLDQVRVQWSSPVGRTPTVDDPRTNGAVIMSWRDLTKSPNEQRHWTAKLRTKTFDDTDGWIQYERI